MYQMQVHTYPKERTTVKVTVKVTCLHFIVIYIRETFKGLKSLFFLFPKKAIKKMVTANMY